ncbi:MAG: hypothetical protein Q4F57_06395 [Weeksellaceae bacterium]|nr:hypothetical protein [Weeksellaceae bacterium]
MFSYKRFLPILIASTLFSACYIYKVPEPVEEDAAATVQAPTRTTVTRSSVAAQQSATLTDADREKLLLQSRENREKERLQQQEKQEISMEKYQEMSDDEKREYRQSIEVEQKKEPAAAVAPAADGATQPSAFARARERAKLQNVATQKDEPIIGGDHDMDEPIAPVAKPRPAASAAATTVDPADLPMEQQILKDKMYRISTQGEEFNILAVRWEQDTLVAHVNRKEKLERRWHKNDITLVENRQFSRGRSDALTFLIYGILGTGAYLLLR